MKLRALLLLYLSLDVYWLTRVQGAEALVPTSGDVVLGNFRFQSGESLPELKIHYRTFGAPGRDSRGRVTNAVMILHGTTGSGAQFLRPEFSGLLFGIGQLLDYNRYYIILPDGIGHGDSSKPSNGLHARFPHYGYRDMVEAQYRLLTEGLKVNHLHVVIGTSMGGMHTWLWGELHPDFMDSLVPLASLPTQISGRNRVWRRMIIDSIQNDPGWHGGEYTQQPQGLKVAAEVLYFMGSNPVQRWNQAPTLKEADEQLNRSVSDAYQKMDANDVLYALRASEDYDPGPRLGAIQAPLLALNFADDLINPPELGILEKEIHRVPLGKSILYPLTDQTRGHGTHKIAAIWKGDFETFLGQIGR
jgi:homoserine O-acetyltransferase